MHDPRKKIELRIDICINLICDRILTDVHFFFSFFDDLHTESIAFTNI